MPLFFTLKSTFKKEQLKIKLWACVISGLMYGIYDIYFYLYSEANIRFDLMLLGPIYYFAIFYWLIVYKQKYNKPTVA